MKWISDLPPAPGDKPQKLSVGDACRRIKDFRLRLNQLTQDIELDGQPLEAETVEEAYIDFSLINYAITKDQAIDAVVKVARSRAYDPVLDWLKDIEKDDSIVPVDLGTIARDYLGVDDKLSNRMFVMALLGAVWRRFHPAASSMLSAFMVPRASVKAQRFRLWLRTLPGSPHQAKKVARTRSLPCIASGSLSWQSLITSPAKSCRGGSRT